MLFGQYPKFYCIKPHKTSKGGMLLTEQIKTMAFEVKKDTIIGDILDADKETAPFFLEMGMHCLGCPSSRGETIEQACAVHGVDSDELVEKLNAHFGN